MKRLWFVVALVACGSPEAKVDAFYTTCGHPGDVGNELGVGKFCELLSDCTETSAPLCSNLGDVTTFFCTKTCHADAGVDECGANASCQCDGTRCGCTPLACP